MTLSASAAQAMDPLQAAVVADQALWNLSEPHPAERLKARDAAVCEASLAGYSHDEIAVALQVRPDDVERIVRT